MGGAFISFLMRANRSLVDMGPEGRDSEAAGASSGELSDERSEFQAGRLEAELPPPRVFVPPVLPRVAEDSERSMLRKASSVVSEGGGCCCSWG